jgi:hypothetical protein
LLSIVAIDASAHTSTAQLGDGYRLALACAAGLAAAATLLSLRIPRGPAKHDAGAVNPPTPARVRRTSPYPALSKSSASSP